MREVVDEETCNFPFDKPAKGGTASSKSTENKRVARSAEGDAEAKAKSIAAGMAGGEPSLVVKVYWENGRQAITATRMAGQLLGGNDAGFEKLSGIGDQAWLGPMASNLTFIKGKTGVELDLRTVPNGREPGIRLAKLIASRLEGEHRRRNAQTLQRSHHAVTHIGSTRPARCVSHDGPV